MSRRRFLGSVGTALAGSVVGAGLGYCAEQEPEYACPYCQEGFADGEELKAHLGSLHSHAGDRGTVAADWPWPVNYGKENEIGTDVLVIGGGLAGAHAAINAHRKGVKVAVIDKGPIAYSGSGGTGIDHWLGCLLNPCSKMTVEMLEFAADKGQGREYGLGNARYIMMREDWDTLKDLEDWGMQIRDVNDEFKGASFRDDKTKLLFAYNTGDGYDMAWRAGAEFVNMEFSHKGLATGGFSYPSYGVGNAHNTWYPCTIVDADGKEVPWVDGNGKRIKTVEKRYRKTRRKPGKLHPASLIHDLPERIRRGEFKLPLYADLPSMPEKERRAIWGLGVGNEGKSRYPIYELYQRYGFNPDKDMLQVPVMSPDAYTFEP